MLKVGRIAALILAPVLASVTIPTQGQERSQRSAAELMDAVMWGKETVGGPFTLVDHAGKARTDADFRGKYLLVYFGFTYCPDICPTDLQVIASALDMLGPVGEQVQPLFITVDPERDTPAHLAQYVPSFHPRLVGLTGSTDQIRKVTDAYKVYFARMADGKSTTIDHSSFIYLMDRGGKYLGFFPPNTSADQLVAVLRRTMRSTHSQ